MPVSGGGFEQAYNAQAGVDVETMMIVTSHVSQQPNDKQEVEPVLDRISELPEDLGTVDTDVPQEKWTTICITLPVLHIQQGNSN
jgi:hypothetical protein